jgi:hypothetical protein
LGQIRVEEEQFIEKPWLEQKEPIRTDESGGQISTTSSLAFLGVFRDGGISEPPGLDGTSK